MDACRWLWLWLCGARDIQAVKTTQFFGLGCCQAQVVEDLSLCFGCCSRPC